MNILSKASSYLIAFLMKVVPVLVCSTFMLLGAESVSGQFMDTSGRVNIYQAIAAHRDETTTVIGAKAENGEGEAELFERWAWYWKQHCDDEGYLVSPTRNISAWREYNILHGEGQRSQRNTGNQGWTFVGPSTTTAGAFGIGRVNKITVDPVDSNLIYVGTLGGGMWKSPDAGRTWQDITHNMPTLSISDIVINPKNPKTMYVCTGDADGLAFYSSGIFKTVDGGNSWQSTGLSWSDTLMKSTNALVINPTDTNHLTMAANDGIYASYDAGKTWNRTLNGYYKQLLYHPTDTNIIYTTSFSYAINGPSAHIYKSSNGGVTFAAVDTFTQAMRIALAVTPQVPNLLKAVVVQRAGSNRNGLQGIYSSANAGANWIRTFKGSDSSNLLNTGQTLAGSGGQGFYDLCIAINPLNANNVIFGGINSWMSVDGGVNWRILNQWYSNLSDVPVTHADKHCLTFQSNHSSTLFEGNDGGICTVTDPINSTEWVDLSDGLSISTYYRISVNHVSNTVLGGRQDNGPILVNDNHDYQLSTGDGMDCDIDFIDSTTLYVETQYGNMDRYSRWSPTGTQVTQISQNIPGKPQGAWITPFSIEPGCHTCLVAGYNQIFRSTDKGNTWSAISPRYNHLFYRVALTPTDPNTIFAFFDTTYNKILFTHNLGQTWDSLVAPFSGKLSDIKIDPFDSSHFWVTFSGYSKRTTRVAEYHHNVWRDISGKNLLPDCPVNSLAVEITSGDLYIGTDLGVYYHPASDSGISWIAVNDGLPIVRVNDLKINYINNEIWVGTYGRGIWKAPLQRAALPFSINTLKVFPNPNKGSFTVCAGLENRNTPLSIALFNSGGQLAFRTDATLDDLGNFQIAGVGLAPGIYFLKVGSARFKGDCKMVIE